MVGEAERGDRRIAAHEADQGPLDVAGQAQPRGDDLVDAGRDEAGAARDDEMGDALDRNLFLEIGDGGEGELRRRLGINLHARASRRQPGMIEAARRDGRAALRRRRQHRPALLDPGALRHAPEQGSAARVGDPRLGPTDESAVHLVRGHGGPDGVDEGGGQARLPGCSGFYEAGA